MFGSAATGDAATAAKILTGWDYTMSLDSAAAAVYGAAAGAGLRVGRRPQRAEVVDRAVGK